MSATYDCKRDKYCYCPECGPYVMGYGNYTVANCYGKTCSSKCCNLHGPWLQCGGRESFETFYADGGSIDCRGFRTDDLIGKVRANAPYPPVSTYALNYWGDNDEFRKRPYGGLVRVGDAYGIIKTGDDSDDSLLPGHYVTDVKGCGSPKVKCCVGPPAKTPCCRNFGCRNQCVVPPLYIPPVPGVPAAKTIESMHWQELCFT